MSLRLAADVGLRFRAAPGSFLYDCHAQTFAPTERGATVASGFVPLYLARLFGVGMAHWHRFLRGAQATLDALSPAERESFVCEHLPKTHPGHAVEVALHAYPSVARFFERRDDGHYRLRDEFLYQPNVPLATLEAKRPGGAWSALTEMYLGSDEGRHTLRSRLAPPHAPAPAPRAGIYAVGHSGLLVRGRRAGLLVDPVLRSVLSGPGSFSVGDLSYAVDATLVTHAHFDHYHLPTLLEVSGRPIVVPPIPRATLPCEDVAARLADFGVREVLSPAWHTALHIGDLRVHVLPFYGEQFLTAEEHPGARNWGSCFVVEHDGARVLIATDSGFERGHSLIEAVSDFVAQHGPISTVFCQAIALRTSFGDGDPDLQVTAITSSHRAGEALDLLRPERRVTLAPEDLPRLCDAACASTLVLYGQFSFVRGKSAVPPELAARVQATLEDSGSRVTLRRVAIGQGMPLSGEGPTLELP